MVERTQRSYLRIETKTSFYFFLSTLRIIIVKLMLVTVFSDIKDSFKRALVNCLKLLTPRDSRIALGQRKMPQLSTTCQAFYLRIPNRPYLKTIFSYSFFKVLNGIVFILLTTEFSRQKVSPGNPFISQKMFKDDTTNN